MAISPENQQKVFETLCSLLQKSDDVRIRVEAVRSLGRLGDERAVPALCLAASQDVDTQVRLIAIDALVYIAKPELLRAMPETPRNQPTFNINQVGNINTGDTSIQGDQIGIQNIQNTEQNFEILLADFQAFVADLQSQHPNITTPAAATQTIANAAQELPQPRWKNFLNLKRLWNGSKKAGIKVGEHFAENNVWGKAAIAFLEGVSENVE